MTALGRHCADTHSILLTDEISRHHPARRPLGAYIGVHHGKRRKNPGLFMDGPTSGLTSSGLVTLEARETNPPRKTPELALQRLAVGDSKTLSLPQRVPPRKLPPLRHVEAARMQASPTCKSTSETGREVRPANPNNPNNHANLDFCSPQKSLCNLRNSIF